jgi:hypothetical protein
MSNVEWTPVEQGWLEAADSNISLYVQDEVITLHYPVTGQDITWLLPSNIRLCAAHPAPQAIPAEVRKAIQTVVWFAEVQDDADTYYYDVLKIVNEWLGSQPDTGRKEG